MSERIRDIVTTKRVLALAALSFGINAAGMGLDLIVPHSDKRTAKGIVEYLALPKPEPPRHAVQAVRRKEHAIARAEQAVASAHHGFDDASQDLLLDSQSSATQLVTCSQDPTVIEADETDLDEAASALSDAQKHELSLLGGNTIRHLSASIDEEGVWQIVTYEDQQADDALPCGLQPGQIYQ